VNYEDLMQERPDGIEPSAENEDLTGFSIVSGGNRDLDDAGMVAHRGTLVGDEYIDMDAFTAAVEEEFGYTLAEVAAVYKAGKPTATQREFRAYIDARVLALSLSGGNMTALAAALNVSDPTIDRALVRARELYVEPQVKNPAVLSTLVCFKDGEPGAKARKRRFSESPPQWVGTINLCDEDYSRGFNEKPGNPAYWEFRAKANA
jgi:hypothetical protein